MKAECLASSGGPDFLCFRRRPRRGFLFGRRCTTNDTGGGQPSSQNPRARLVPQRRRLPQHKSLFSGSAGAFMVDVVSLQNSKRERTLMRNLRILRCTVGVALLAGVIGTGTLLAGQKGKPNPNGNPNA